MALRSCPVCHESAAKNKVITHSPEGGRGLSWPLIECAGCGLAYVPECPSDDALYTPSYYGKSSGLSRWIFEPFNLWWVRRKARRLMALAQGRRWLDYGCGRGDLLEALKADGADIWGIETQKDCALMLGKRWPGRVGVSLEEIAIPAEGWNGLVLYHVLEHLENPAETLTQLRRFAQEGAVLFLAIPYWGSWERRAFGDRWFHLDVPRHVQHFSPDNLKRLLGPCGWSVQRIEFKITAYDLFGFFQSLLNLGPGPRNFFYRCLKRNENIDVSVLAFGAGLVWNGLAIIPATIFTILLVPLFAFAKSSGTFEITACVKTLPR